MKIIKAFEKFSGKIKEDQDLDTQDVLDLANLLLELKPQLSDDFPDLEMSKLIKNNVRYKSDDDVYNINVIFNESDVYKDEEDINRGKYKTIYKVKITRQDGESIKISEVKDFISLIIQLIEKTYDDVEHLIKFTEDKEITKIKLEDFEKLKYSKKVDSIYFIIKIM
jgi:hypothetical protein